jgi:hypothetical protein
MTHAQFPWRPLGTLLVEQGLLAERELDEALTEQRRTGRLLGQILVDRDYLSGFSLTRALADQHGVELRSKRPRQIPVAKGEAQTWRPLGKLLVANHFVTETELEQALAEQRQRRARLGEILVARGYLSGPTLARALAEQHGLDPNAVRELEADVETAIRRDTPGEPLYQVCDLGSVLYESPNFLDAADFAGDLVQRRNPDALEIDRTRAYGRETVWTYSRAAAEAASSKSLVETFGFDPTLWNGGVRPDSGPSGR